MDKPVLIIDAPELDDEAVESVYSFLHELINAFDVHYYYRLQQRHRKRIDPDDSANDEEEEHQDPPF